jgi:very-short-patch-repair endonuclease
MKRSKGELILESHLNAYKIAFEAEYRFCERRWRFDFAFPLKRVAVEVEGGIYTFGRHNRPTGMIADMAKYNEAAAMGWTVLRFTPQQVKKGEAINKILKTLGEIVSICPPGHAIGSVTPNIVKPCKRGKVAE